MLRPEVEQRTLPFLAPIAHAAATAVQKKASGLAAQCIDCTKDFAGQACPAPNIMVKGVSGLFMKTCEP